MYTLIFLLFGCFSKPATTKVETATAVPALPSPQELFAANEYPDFQPQLAGRRWSPITEKQDAEAS